VAPPQNVEFEISVIFVVCHPSWETRCPIKTKFGTEKHTKTVGSLSHVEFHHYCSRRWVCNPRIQNLVKFAICCSAAATECTNQHEIWHEKAQQVHCCMPSLLWIGGRDGFMGKTQTFWSQSNLRSLAHTADTIQVKYDMEGVSITSMMHANILLLSEGVLWSPIISVWVKLMVRATWCTD